MKSHTNTLIAALALAASLLGGSAIAESYPAPLQAAVDAGLRVEKSFKTPAGLTGWVVQQGGKFNVIYTTADGKFLISGALIDSAGQNLTSKYSDEEIPKPDYSAVWPKLEKTAYIVDGASDKAAKATLYVLTDPNCPHCHHIWETVQPLLSKGLQVRWVTVAILGPQSTDRAAAILASKDPLNAMKLHNAAFGTAAMMTAVPSSEVTQAIKDKLADNRRLMSELGMTGTPGLIYKDAKGIVRTVNGAPSPIALARLVNID